MRIDTDKNVFTASLYDPNGFVAFCGTLGIKFQTEGNVAYYRAGSEKEPSKKGPLAK